MSNINKYYVRSGNLRECVVAESPYKACQAAINKRNLKDGHINYGTIIMVTTRSFAEFLTEEEKTIEAKYFATHIILNHMGFLDTADFVKAHFDAENVKNNHEFDYLI